MGRIKKLLIAGTILSVSLNTGCSSILKATTDGPIQNASEERSFGKFWDDQQIETVADVNIAHASESLADAPITVISYNGVVLAVGQVRTKKEREQVTNILRKIRGVRQVHNQITVGPKISSLVRASDSWLTTKVKTQLALDDKNDFSNLKIVTENSSVYLIGIMSQRKGQQAGEIARTISGVQHVVLVSEPPE